MPTFSYVAKNTGGETESGTFQAASKIEVARDLRSRGFVPITIEEKKAGKAGKSDFNILKLDIGPFFDKLRGVSLTDKIMFSRHLAVMIAAGVPITRALDTLSRQTKNIVFKTAILQVEKDIRGGTRMADAFAKHPKTFDTLYVSMIRSGDATGNIVDVLNLLADHLKKEHDLRSRVKGALMYPAVIVTAMGGIGALMMTVVVPKIAAIFKDLDAELPFLTKIVIGISEFISSYWYIVFGSLPVFIFLFKRFAGTELGKKFFSRLFLKLPLFSGLTRKINSARFARTLSSLVAGAVPILEALSITKDTLANFYYRESLSKMHESVKGGKPLFESIVPFENIYPGLVVQMVRVGEETGALGDVLKRIAEFYEEEVDNATKNLSSIIEPILMLIIGAVVGVFAVSMIQPMYSMMGNL